MHQVRRSQFLTALAFSLSFPLAGAAKPPVQCTELYSKYGVQLLAHKPVSKTISPADGACTIGAGKIGPAPDAKCSPGAVNPTVTLALLTAPGFTTKCLRDQATSAAKKDKTYGWYSVTKPTPNTGANQTCEKDHIIPLVIGGADTMDNIWPQCGPEGVEAKARFFKQKDEVECYLMTEVKAKRMTMAAAQKGIAKDWTQYADKAHGASCSTKASD